MKQTRVLQTDPQDPSPVVIAEAAAVLRRGGLVAFPTETVYGLGANALDEAAVRAVFAAKGRPANDPLIVHVASAEEVWRVVREFPPRARRLAEACWPGPLTLLLPRAPVLPLPVTAGLDTVGVRVPSHPVALALIKAAGVPVAAPSANRFGHTSPTRAEHVLHDLAGQIDLVVDGGETTVGVESTVLDVTADPPRVLRPGGVTVEALERLLGTRVAVGAQDEQIRAPGQLLRHYAPRACMIVFEGTAEAALHAIGERAEDSLRQGRRVGLLLATDDLARLPHLAQHPRVAVERLGPSTDLAAVARHLYDALRRLDARQPDVILARTFGTSGLGLAITDRLRRAAEGRVIQIRS